MSFDPSNLTEREYYFTTLPDVEPPKSFRHNAPTRPVEPDTSEMTPEEAMEAREEHARAMEAWRAADALARMTQYRWAMADAAIENKPVTTTAASADEPPSEPPPPYLPPGGSPPIEP